MADSYGRVFFGNVITTASRNYVRSKLVAKVSILCNCEKCMPGSYDEADRLVAATVPGVISIMKEYQSIGVGCFAIYPSLIHWVAPGTLSQIWRPDLL